MDAESLELVLLQVEEDCQKTLAAFRRDLQKVRTGRASSGLVEGIQVDVYGSKMQLSHIAQISTPESRLIQVQVFDASSADSAEKAIRNSGLGFNPSREGSVIRIVIPPLTEENRRDIVKRLYKMAEDIKVSMRAHRRDANEAIKKIEKDGNASKDECKKVTDTVQTIIDKSIVEVDKMLSAKEAECMEV